MGTVRQGFFAPRFRVKSYDELDAWLEDRCLAWAKAHRHPELPDTTIWQAFEAERPSLVPYPGPVDGFNAVPAVRRCLSDHWRSIGSLSKTCLVRTDSNKYSVSGSAVGPPVEIRAYAERIEIRHDDRLVGEHRRAFGRGKTVYDPWHYVPVLARKPGAMRNGAPFKDWDLPPELERIRRKLRAVPDGDRQMVQILAAVIDDGLDEVEAACAEALADGVRSADVVLNVLARRREPEPPTPTMTPEAPRRRRPSGTARLAQEPVAACRRLHAIACRPKDCARYDNLRRAARCWTAQRS